jgi:hypothetical protein
LGDSGGEEWGEVGEGARAVGGRIAALIVATIVPLITILFLSLEDKELEISPVMLIKYK